MGSLLARARLSDAGLLIGALLFAAALTPSLAPRDFLLQGALSGLSMAIGYGIGVLAERAWRYLQLPGAPALWARRLRQASWALAAAIVLIFLWLAAGWQDDVRQALELPPDSSANPVLVALVALAAFAALLALARGVGWIIAALSARLRRRLPRRLANLLGASVGLLLVWLVLEGVVIRLAMNMADSSLRGLDALMEPEFPQPTDPMKAGGPGSLVGWRELGRRGREFVVGGPSAAQISALLGGPAREPIRVYVGLNSAQTPRARARLALAELQRVGAFDRSVLVVMVPTGTGFLDPAASDTLEYLHRGDVASVAVQYSYLVSWMSLFTEPQMGADTAQAVFDEVYGYWRTLPRGDRPRLYLHGLSLGALNSQQSIDLLTVAGDPFDGAVWSGPPFRSAMWRRVTAARTPGSPVWLPRYRDGSVVRFTNQTNQLNIPGARWGPMRIVYVQYASDPISFIDADVVWRRPEWLDAPRGPDVSRSLRWVPVVTALQLAVDTTVADTLPPGRGHKFSAANYIDAWTAVTAPADWSAQDDQRLRAAMVGR